MLTLADIQTTRFQSVSGYTPGSDDFLECANDVIDELLRRGDWSDTQKVIRVKVDVTDWHITWPRFVGEIRKVNTCRRDREVPMHNMLYQFMEGHGEHHRCWDDFAGWRAGECSLEAQGRYPTFKDIPGNGYNVRLTVDVAVDVGSTVTLFGVDNNNNPLQTQNADGTWIQGVTLVAVMPFSATPGFVSRIDRVVCTKTNSIKRLWAFNSTTGDLQEIAIYDPAETNPDFQRSRISNARHYGIGNGMETVIALIKLAKLPIINPNDPLIISNRGALLDGFRAVKAEDANNPALALSCWKSAIEKMNRQLENDSPDDNFSVQNNTWGSDRCFTQHCF
jgi:hypothetical protein